MKSTLKYYLIYALALTACDGKIYVETVNPPGSGKQGAASTEVKAPDIFVAGDAGYKTYRIPALVKTKSGSLLAFCEGRNGTGDTGNIDLIMRRSTDGGKNWSAITIIWNDGANTCGNPCPVVDPETGRIHLLMTWNLGTDGKSAGDFNIIGKTDDTRRVWYCYSDDDGKKWSEPIEITSSAKQEDWGWYATGPCHAIIKQKDPFKGRIIIPCDCHVRGVTAGTGYSHIIYSDDSGKTWHIGGKVAGGNESTVAELSDGRLILNMRASGGYRKVSYSSDGGASFGAGQAVYTLPDPTCQAAILDADINGQHLLFFSNAASSTSRVNMTLRKSSDDGASWSSGYIVWDGSSAYSDIVMIDDSYIGILYEKGSSKNYEKISFEKIAVSRL